MVFQTWENMQCSRWRSSTSQTSARRHKNDSHENESAICLASPRKIGRQQLRYLYYNGQLLCRGPSLLQDACNPLAVPQRPPSSQPHTFCIRSMLGTQGLQHGGNCVPLQNNLANPKSTWMSYNMLRHKIKTRVVFNRGMSHRVARERTQRFK